MPCAAEELAAIREGLQAFEAWLWQEAEGQTLPVEGQVIRIANEFRSRFLTRPEKLHRVMTRPEIIIYPDDEGDKPSWMATVSPPGAAPLTPEPEANRRAEEVRRWEPEAEG